jgi:hypothetical protein
MTAAAFMVMSHLAGRATLGTKLLNGERGVGGEQMPSATDGWHTPRGAAERL